MCRVDVALVTLNGQWAFFFFLERKIDIWAVETPPKFRADKKKRLGRAGRRGAAQGASLVGGSAARPPGERRVEG